MTAGEVIASPQSRPHHATLTIWVVDDDPMALTAARLLLEELGYGAQGYTDPRKLMASLRAPDALPNLILADLYMPEMTGIEVIQHITAEFPELPVTIMTSSRDLDGSVTAINQGAFGYLLKPIVPEQLEWLVGRLRREQALKEGIREEQLRLAHAERLAKLGTLTSGIAHEINNPNCFVLGNIDFLEKLWTRLEPELAQAQDSDTDAVQCARAEMPGILRELRSGANRIANIVRSLSMYSRREPDQATRTNLRSAIEDAATVLRNKLSVLDFEVDEGSHGEILVAVNTTDLDQVLVNLISNAADAAAGTAEPAVSIQFRMLGESQVRVDVVDNGTGVDPDRLPMIEAPFFTTKDPGAGTGLGLYITRQLVNRAGGTLSYANNPGRGATFSITLPAVME